MRGAAVLLRWPGCCSAAAPTCSRSPTTGSPPAIRRRCPRSRPARGRGRRVPQRRRVVAHVRQPGLPPGRRGHRRAAGNHPGHEEGRHQASARTASSIDPTVMLGKLYPKTEVGVSAGRDFTGTVVQLRRPTRCRARSPWWCSRCCPTACCAWRREEPHAEPGRGIRARCRVTCGPRTSLPTTACRRSAWPTPASGTRAAARSPTPTTRLAGALLQQPADALLRTASMRFLVSLAALACPCAMPAHAATRAAQPRQRRGRARQPARGLRPGRGPERQRRQHPGQGVSSQSVANLLKQFGVKMPEGQRPRARTSRP